MLWKYILFMKKARLDFPKNSLYSPRCGFAGCSRPSEDVERGARHCKASLSGPGCAKGSICQKVLESFSLLNTFPAQSQTHCLRKGRTLVTATPREPAGLRTSALEPGLGQRGGERGEEKNRGWEGAMDKVREGQESRRKCGVDGK
ncbi:hypothetical protein CesoFtcFv8_025573 [Champsocephalus esox]|uniref:Uncharacterized protein n=1 Tax=Champsocephalus esox TaxID=159716 RepID=A0AAN8GFA2_9TELE|nr:hypothetical protein CesoFtcFv8_025573 [Champsocephalus esox]